MEWQVSRVYLVSMVSTVSMVSRFRGRGSGMAGDNVVYLVSMIKMRFMRGGSEVSIINIRV